MKTFLFAVCVSAFIFSCGNQNQHEHDEHNAAIAPAQNREDSLYKEVIALHDAVMPKMGKLMGYKNALQARLDSLDNLTKVKKDVSVATSRKQYINLIAQVTKAEKEMNDWMDQFNPDPQLGSTEEKVQYFEDQKQKAARMKADVLAALESAAAVLPQ